MVLTSKGYERHYTKDMRFFGKNQFITCLENFEDLLPR